MIYFLNTLPNQIKDSNRVLKKKGYGKKKIEEGILGIYWLHYLREFNLYLDIVLIVHNFLGKESYLFFY